MNVIYFQVRLRLYRLYVTACRSSFVAILGHLPFERVWHKVVFDIYPSLCDLAEFLSDRSVVVVINRNCSLFKSINGSVFSGFCYFLRYLLTITSLPIHSYADSSTVCFSFYFERCPSQQHLAFARMTVLEHLIYDLYRILIVAFIIQFLHVSIGQPSAQL